MANQELHYGAAFTGFLEEMWGEGYLSPGGPEEVARLLAGIELCGKRVVDIGCGSGGITLSLARDYGAASVLGLDVEAPVCAQAEARVQGAGMADRIDILCAAPGPMPLADGSADIVFSKDSIVHIPDKEALARDAYRLLVPGGWFVASDWLIAHDEPPSPAMQDYLILEDLDFGMASPRRYRAALEAAGFEEIVFTNRNSWYLGLAREELSRVRGPSRANFEKFLGVEGVTGMIETWQAMIPVLESGEHCPHHFRARKPG